MSDLEIATAQLESWIENKATVGLILRVVFAVGLNEAGSLERFEEPLPLQKTLSRRFILIRATPLQRFDLKITAIRCGFKYDCGFLTICDRKPRELSTES